MGRPDGALGATIPGDRLRQTGAYPQPPGGKQTTECAVFALDPQGAEAFLGPLRPALETAAAAGGPRAAVDAFFGVVCPGLWRTLSEPLRDKYRANATELFGDLQMPPYQVSQDDLARLSTPCLMISGSESAPVLRGIARIIADSIPGCRFVELMGSDHVTYYERPEEFASAVGDFAGSLGVSAV